MLFSFSFYGAAIPEDPSKAVSSIAIGDNTYARTGSVMIGPHNYNGDLGDKTVNMEEKHKLGVDVFATTIGANSYTNGAFAVNTGAYNIISGSYSGGNSDSSKASQNFGATITGSLNSIESSKAGNFSGIANSIVGVANRTSNSNGSLIFGAGNVITNSITDLDGTQEVADSAKKFQQNLIDSVKDAESGGAALAIGGSNTIDYAQKSQVMGVGNTLKGKSGNVSKFNFIDGYKNTAEKVTNVSVLGSNNTVSEAESTQIIGDKRKVTKAKDSVVIGSAEKETELKVNNATILGYNANVTKEGGVALGYGSIASTDKGEIGYDPSKKGPSDQTTSTWIATDAAVSVGNGTNITRQITGVAAGTQDTDAVNVAQLKQVQVAINAKVDTDTRNTVAAGDHISLKEDAQADGSTKYTVSVKTDGKVAPGDTGIVTGDTVYRETRTASDGFVTKSSATAGENILALDKQVKTNSDQIATINQNVDNMGRRINNLDSKINKVGAGAAALAALHPQDFDPEDKWDFAAGFGNYRDANAMAIGAFYRPDNKTMFSVGGSMGNGENMVNVGVSLKFGKSSPYAGMSKAALVNTIEDMKAKDAKRDEVINQQQKEIEDLKAAVAKLMTAK